MKKFTRFFRDNYSFVVGVAERRLGSREDAEEVAADAFRIAWQRYEAGDQLSVPWLYGVVRNRIGDEYRRRDRRAELQRKVNEDLALNIPILDELYSDVRDAVERLPQGHRDILRMAYWERLTSREIAAVLNSNSAAVRARLMRARRLLRAELDQLQDRIDEEVSIHE